MDIYEALDRDELRKKCRAANKHVANLVECLTEATQSCPECGGSEHGDEVWGRRKKTCDLCTKWRKAITAVTGNPVY